MVKDFDYVIDPVWDGSSMSFMPPDYILWDFEYLKIPQIWTEYGVRGEKVNTYIIDTGISEHHAFVHQPRLKRYSFVGDGNPIDNHGHGSWCSGKVGAAGIGLAPQCNITSLKALDDYGRGYDLWVNKALEFILNEPDPHIVNMSLGGSGKSSEQEKLINALYDKGCIVVAAAGNANTAAPHYPAAFDKALAIAAIDNHENKAYFSNYGKHIVVAAPGVSCYSVFKKGYRKLQGTSMASPMVVGLLTLGASLLLKKNTSISRSTMRDILIDSLTKTAKDLGKPGKDEFYGFGSINGIKFMKAIRDHG